MGFSPTSYTVHEDTGDVSVCAKVYEVAGNVQNTEVSLRTSPDGETVSKCYM